MAKGLRSSSLCLQGHYSTCLGAMAGAGAQAGQRCRGKKVHGQGLERRGAGPSHSRGRAYIKTPKKEGKNFGNRKKFDKKTDFPEAEVRRVTV